MKLQINSALYTAVLFLICAGPVRGDDSITFQDYKKLSLQGRKKVAGNAGPWMAKRFNNWNEIIRRGGQSWEDWQADYLIDIKDIDGFGALLAAQSNLWESYHGRRVAGYKKAGMPEPQALEATDRDLKPVMDMLSKEASTYQHRYLVEVAPSD